MKLGDKVLCDMVFKRRQHYVSHGGVTKTWRPQPISPRLGVFLGQRTLSNGRRDWEDEVGYIYVPSEYVRAALVVFSERERPVYVPLDALREALL